MKKADELLRKWNNVNRFGIIILILISVGIVLEIYGFYINSVLIVTLSWLLMIFSGIPFFIIFNIKVKKYRDQVKEILNKK